MLGRWYFRNYLEPLGWGLPVCLSHFRFIWTTFSCAASIVITICKHTFRLRQFMPDWIWWENTVKSASCSGRVRSTMTDRDLRLCQERQILSDCFTAVTIWGTNRNIHNMLQSVILADFYANTAEAQFLVWLLCRLLCDQHGCSKNLAWSV